MRLLLGDVRMYPAGDEKGVSPAVCCMLPAFMPGIYWVSAHIKWRFYIGAGGQTGTTMPAKVLRVNRGEMGGLDWFGYPFRRGLVCVQQYVGTRI